MKLTAEEIEAGKSPKGGFTRDQLEKWGVPWPPPKGWKRKLMGKPEQPDAQFSRSQQLRMTLTPDRYWKLQEMCDLTAIELHQYALIMLSKAIDRGDFLVVEDWWQGTEDHKMKFDEQWSAETDRVMDEIAKLVPAESYFHKDPESLD